MTRRAGTADLPLHNGRVPPWLAAWLPNFLFTATGMVLMKLVR